MTTKNLSLILFACGLVIVLVVQVMDYRQSSFVLKTFRAVEESQQTLITINKLASYLKDIQRSHRGYVITGKNEFLIPYENAVEAVPAILADLSNHVHDAKQLRTLDTLTSKIFIKINYVENAIVQVNTRNQKRAMEGIPAGKKIFDSMIADIALIERNERIYTEGLKARVDNEAQTNFLIIFIGTTISTTLMLLAIGFIYISQRRVEKLSKSLAKSNQELGSFNEELTTMNEQLETSSNQLIQTQKQLEHREKQLLQAQELSKTGSLDWNIITDAIIFSPQFAKLWGIRENDKTKTFKSLMLSVTSEDSVRVKKAIEHAVSTKSGFRFSFRIHKNQEIIHLATYAEPYFENDELCGYLATVTDITENIKANETLRLSEAKFRSLLESAPDPMIIASADGRIKIVNKQTEKLFGYTKDQLIEKEIDILLPYKVQNELLSFKGTYIQNPKAMDGNFKITLNGLKKNGEEVPVEVTISPFQTQEDVYITAAIRDVTEQQNTEKKILEANTQFEKANEALKKANDELNAFSYSISHDLKAPLRAINGYTSLLKEDFEANMTDSAKNALQVIQRNATRMDHLINDLLELARLGSKAVTKENLNMKNIVENILMEKNVEQKVKLIIHSLPEVPGDYSLVRQVWENLISNAIKFSSKIKEPLVEIGYDKRADKIIYWIKDNGVGFDPAYSEKLFKVFSRLHAKHEFEGTGAGLAIARKIVEAHGGSMWAEAALHKGAKFYFDLPVH